MTRATAIRLVKVTPTIRMSMPVRVTTTTKITAMATMTEGMDICLPLPQADRFNELRGTLNSKLTMQLQSLGRLRTGRWSPTTATTTSARIC